MPPPAPESRHEWTWLTRETAKRAFGILGYGLALAAAPATAQPALPSTSVLLIRLAVAGARCTGSHQKMVVRYRQLMLRDHADGLRAAGQAMTRHYRAVHGEDWRTALDADMNRLRTRFEQDLDQAGFCNQTALQARDVAGDFESSAGRSR